MGDASKGQLHDAIAKLTREKQMLESQVKSLISQKLQLEKSLAVDSIEKKKYEDSQIDVQRELSELREKYEGAIWHGVELEDQIAVLESELEVTNEKLGHLAEAKTGTDQLDIGLSGVKESAKLVIAERQTLEREKAKIEAELRDVKRQLKDEIDSRAAVAESLEKKKSWLKKKLQSRVGLEELLLEMHSDNDSLQRDFQREKIARQKFELQFDEELADIHRRMLLEAANGEKWEERIRDAAQLRQNIHSEIEVLRSKIDSVANELSSKLAQHLSNASGPVSPSHHHGSLGKGTGSRVVRAETVAIDSSQYQSSAVPMPINTSALTSSSVFGIQTTTPQMGQPSTSPMSTSPSSSSHLSTDVANLLVSIDGEMSAINDILTQGLPLPDQISKNFREMKLKFDNQLRLNREIEEKNRLLEVRLSELESCFAKEQRARKQLEEKLETLWKVHSSK